MQIITEKLEIEETLNKRIKNLLKFLNIKAKLQNCNIIHLSKTNLNYIEPHRIIIKGITFLAFNYSNEIFIGNLSKSIKLSVLENYINKLKLYINVLTFSKSVYK